ncbi:MAG: hypothetical protein K2I51_01355 [Muribaculaceae bacterium]|nr:hypothetical protein [Muribaculaceae bacterium]
MKTISAIISIIAGVLLLTGCSGGSTPLKDLADVYAEMADNNQEVFDAFQAVYKASREEQGLLQEKAAATAERIKGENERLADKAAALGEKLQGKEIECQASAALGIKITSATFTTVKAQENMANIVITVEADGTPDETPYFFFMNGDKVIYKSVAGYNNGKITVGFNLTSSKGAESADMARQIADTRSIMLVTKSEYNAGAASNEVSAKAESDQVEASEPEPVYQGGDESDSVDAVSADGVKIEKGANIIAVLKAAPEVYYEYNADSGIWAQIGNVAIIIDEDQLNQKGTEFISSILSDIELDIAFSVDYLKPDAKIRNIEKL